MRFLADENIAPTVVFALRNAGHDVIDVKEQGWYGKPDKDLIAYTLREKRIIITHDKDFMDQEKVAVILLRFFNQSPKNVSLYLLQFLTESVFVRKLLRPTVAIISEFGVEFHHPR